MDIDPKLVRSAYIGKTLKNIINDKNITITSIAEKIGTYHPAISSVLNGKKSGADKFFKKIAEAVGLSDHKIKEIFKNADKEEFKYKYGESPQAPNLLEDIDFEVALRREYGTDLDSSTIRKIKEFIEFVKNR